MVYIEMILEKIQLKITDKINIFCKNDRKI